MRSTMHTVSPIRRHAGAPILLLVTALVAAPTIAAEDVHRLTVPLSNTGKPASVDVGLVLGTIRVTAGSAGEVVIEATRGDDDDDENYDEDDGPVSGKAKDKSSKEGKTLDGGLRRISTGSSLDLSAEEENNQVTVRSNGVPRHLALRLRVPAGSSLKLSTVSGGAIDVEGITGELELHNTNGPIRARGVGGPVTANTVNGDVEVSFAPGATIGGSMAFSTLNGDVDLTLPAKIDVNLRLRTEQGEIYSDFDVDLTTEPAKVEKDGTQKKYRITIAKELVGRIGAGGPELFLKSFNGDIVLRQSDGS